MKAVCFCLIASLVSAFAQTDAPSQLADRAEQLIRDGDKAGALQALAEAAHATPSTAESEDRIAFLFAVLGEKLEATQHFERSVALDGKYAPAHYHLGIALWQNNDRERAVAELEAAAKLGPDVFDYCYHLGSVYMQTGNYNRAVIELKHAVALDPSKAPAWEDLARSLEGENDLVGAKSAYEQALARDQANEAVRTQYAFVLIETREADRGIEESRKVLAADPSNTAAWMNIGYAYLKKGEFDSAEQAYRETLKADPNLPAAHYDLGLALKMQDKIEPAQNEFKDAIRLDPSLAEAHYSLGIACWQAGEFPAAIEQMRAAIAIRPEYAEAHYMLGIVLKQSGDLDTALAELKESIRLDPNTPGPYNTIGQILRIKGDKQGSEQAFATGARLKHDKEAQLANTLDQGMRGGMAVKPLSGAPR